jgi:hypothetical protein
VDGILGFATIPRKKREILPVPWSRQRLGPPGRANAQIMQVRGVSQVLVVILQIVKTQMLIRISIYQRLYETRTPRCYLYRQNTKTLIFLLPISSRILHLLMPNFLASPALSDISDGREVTWTDPNSLTWVSHHYLRHICLLIPLRF